MVYQTTLFGLTLFKLSPHEFLVKPLTILDKINLTKNVFCLEVFFLGKDYNRAFKLTMLWCIYYLHIFLQPDCVRKTMINQTI